MKKITRIELIGWVLFLLVLVVLVVVGNLIIPEPKPMSGGGW